MRQLLISLMNHRYPFGQAPYGSSAQVEEIQIFSNIEDLCAKKTEMLKKNDVLTNSYIIKLITVYQQNLELHYIYEYVPYTLSSYILMKNTTQNRDLWQTTKRHFMKKITYQLTILISYLAKMRIELDLKIDNLGLTEKEKLKVYMNAKCRMGYKTQLSLINTYSHRKDKILYELHQYVQSLQREDFHPPHFKIDRNKLIFDQKDMSSSYLVNDNVSKRQEKLKDTGSAAKLKKSDTKPHLTRRKSSFVDFQSNSSPSDPKPKYQPAFRRSKPQQNQYKYRWEGIQNPYKSSIPQSKRNTDDYEGSPTDPTFSRSKQIKIELQQNQNQNGEKERKKSFKVKITSFRQYEVDNCDPEQLFPSKWPSDEDVFAHFQKRAEQDEQERQERQYDAKRKERKTTSETQNTLPPPFIQRHATQTPLSECTEHSHSRKELEVKVQAARQRAVKLLNKMKKLKK